MQLGRSKRSKRENHAHITSHPVPEVTEALSAKRGPQQARPGQHSSATRFHLRQRRASASWWYCAKFLEADLEREAGLENRLLKVVQSLAPGYPRKAHPPSGSHSLRTLPTSLPA